MADVAFVIAWFKWNDTASVMFLLAGPKYPPDLATARLLIPTMCGSTSTSTIVVSYGQRYEHTPT